MFPGISQIAPLYVHNRQCVVYETHRGLIMLPDKCHRIVGRVLLNDRQKSLYNGVLTTYLSVAVSHVTWWDTATNNETRISIAYTLKCSPVSSYNGTCYDSYRVPYCTYHVFVRCIWCGLLKRLVQFCNIMGSPYPPNSFRIISFLILPTFLYFLPVFSSFVYISAFYPGLGTFSHLV